MSLVEPASSFLSNSYCPPTRRACSEITSDPVSVCFPIPYGWGPPSRSHFPTLQVGPSEQESLSQFSIRNQPNPTAITDAWIPALLPLPPVLASACIPLPSPRPCSHWHVHPPPIPAPPRSSPPHFPPNDAPPAVAARLTRQPTHSVVSPPLTSRRWQSALPTATPPGLPLPTQL
jgi:hypothetical protein